jgi:pimeloyl-ACP methyl ester carboxylesterase
MKKQMMNNGRRLSFEDSGPRDGKPVFYFHGVPSASSEWRMWGDEEMLNSLTVRLIEGVFEIKESIL